MAAGSPSTGDPGDHLADATAMDAVTLHVRDLPGMTAYYRDALALTVRSEGGGQVELGRGADPLMVLRHTPDLPVAAAGQAGLFHTALLFDDEESLAASLATAARHPRSLFVGSADHLVSNSFYFTDPEGNGLELYVDRPRDTWAYSGGQVQMAVLPLDPDAFLSRHLTETALDGVAAAHGQVGHVHLKVGDIPTARAFYVGALGFALTLAAPTALFVSAGGYHHHMAMNTWTSRGAGPRAATLGLGQVAITVPGREDLDALVDRLRHHSIAVRDDGQTVRFEDPWRSLIEVSAG